MSSSDELDELKKRRIEELQRSFAENQEQQNELTEQVSQLEAMVRPRLSRDAQSRYANLKLAFPEKAMKALVVLAKYIQATSGKEVTDVQFKDLLLRLEPEKKEFKITRK